MLRVLRKLRAILSHAPLRVAVFAAFAFVVMQPALQQSDQTNEFRDAQLLQVSDRSARRSVLEYGEFPFWDPYYCGGREQLGAPQSRIWTPAFLPILAFGADAGEALTWFFMLLLGCEGAFRFARPYGSPVGAALGAMVFAASGFFAVCLAYGWLQFSTYYLVPWVAVGIREVWRGRLIGAVIAALAFAAIIGGGGTYSAPMAVFFGVLEGGIGLLRMRRRGVSFGRVRALSGLFLTFAMALALPRLLPLLEASAAIERVVVGKQSHLLDALWDMATGTPDVQGGNVESWVGYFHVGEWWFWAFGAVLFATRRVRTLMLLLSMGVFVWAATGYAYESSPHAWLRTLPVLSVLRSPERYLLGALLLSVPLFASMFRALEVRARRFPVYVLVHVLAAVPLVLAIQSSVRNFHSVTDARVMGVLYEGADDDYGFRQSRGNRWAAVRYVAVHRGSLNCMEAYAVPMSTHLRAGLPAEEYVGEGQGSVRRVAWSPNRIRLAVQAESAVRVHINQNWHPGWHSDVGEVVSHDGLLALELPAGEHDVRLRMAPRAARAGLLAALLALPLLLALSLLAARLPLAALFGLSTVPLIAAAVFYGLQEEANFARPEAFDEHGATLRSEKPAHGPLARFMGGTELYALSVPSEAEVGESLFLDLRWVRGESHAAGSGIFVHITRDGVPIATRDHTKLASELRIGEAPVGEAMRDPVEFEAPSQEGVYGIYVGLWMPHENARVPLETLGQEDRVHLGELIVHAAPEDPEDEVSGEPVVEADAPAEQPQE